MSRTVFVVEYVAGQAEGAYPNGSRVRKVWSDQGDSHQVGALATVVSSVVCPGVPGTDKAIGYFVCWDDAPGLPCFVADKKIAREFDA